MRDKRRGMMGEGQGHRMGDNKYAKYSTGTVFYFYCRYYNNLNLRCSEFLKAKYIYLMFRGFAKFPSKNFAKITPKFHFRVLQKFRETEGKFRKTRN